MGSGDVTTEATTTRAHTSAGPVWRTLVLIGVLSFPSAILSAACLAVGLITGVSSISEASITLLPMSSLLGLVPVTFAALAATRLVQAPNVPRWAARVAVLLVVLGGLLQAGLAVALMTPGLVELP
jgi:hypothetical protein